jgi:hypothetical protein
MGFPSSRALLFPLYGPALSICYLPCLHREKPGSDAMAVSLIVATLKGGGSVADVPLL